MVQRYGQVKHGPGKIKRSFVRRAIPNGNTHLFRTICCSNRYLQTNILIFSSWLGNLPMHYATLYLWTRLGSEAL